MQKIKVYIPIKKTKHKKSNIRGFWQSDNKTLYYDYIKIVKADISELEALRCKYRQIALFYVLGNEAFIYEPDKTIELKKCYKYVFIYGICSIKKQLKRLLKQYGGFTVYIKADCYYIEAWQ